MLVLLAAEVSGGISRRSYVAAAMVVGLHHLGEGAGVLILEELEKSHQKHSLTKPVGGLASRREGFQMSFFQLDDPILKQIRDEISNLDVDNLTPIEALNKLNEIKKITGLDKS